MNFFYYPVFFVFLPFFFLLLFLLRILSLSSVHLFPVDIVYATIEIKTRLTSAEAERACQNVISVKELEMIPGDFAIVASSQDGLTATTYEPTHPLGVVFSYSGDVQKFESFKQWFVPEIHNLANIKKYPSIVACLDQGFVFNDTVTGEPSQAGAVALHYGNGPVAKVVDTNVKEFPHEGVIYPVKTVKGERVLIDEGRVLLIFVARLTESLATKFINPSIKFSEHYFDDYTTFRIEV